MALQLPVSDLTRARNAKEEKDLDRSCQESLISSIRDGADQSAVLKVARNGLAAVHRRLTPVQRRKLNSHRSGV